MIALFSMLAANPLLSAAFAITFVSLGIETWCVRRALRDSLRDSLHESLHAPARSAER